VIHFQIGYVKEKSSKKPVRNFSDEMCANRNFKKELNIRTNTVKGGVCGVSEKVLLRNNNKRAHSGEERRGSNYEGTFR
jgi:hypothetical protein